MSARIPQKLRDAVLERDGYLCQRCGRHIHVIGYSLQHRRPKQMGGSKLLNTMENLVTMCGSATDPRGCHAWAELNRPAARDTGWLVPHGVKPGEWPVRHFDGKWWKAGEIWVPSLPHPRQLQTTGEVA